MNSSIGSPFGAGAPIGFVGSGGVAFSTGVHDYGTPIGFATGSCVYSSGTNGYGTPLGFVSGTTVHSLGFS